jgi:adenosylhomocysteine nucleosidase
MSRLILISALDREIAPLVRGWKRSERVEQKRKVVFFENEKAIVAYAGMGVISARIAADSAYKHAGSDVSAMISVGLAGALKPELKVGDTIQPAIVRDAVDNLKIETRLGKGTLVTASSVASREYKQQLASQFQADAVDMEAYAVADVAQVYGVPFAAIKVISDELDFEMPPLNRFVTPDGEFRTAAFAFHVATRPWLIPSTMALGKNSSKAVESLCARLQKVVSDGPKSLYNIGNSSQ